MAGTDGDGQIVRAMNRGGGCAVALAAVTGFAGDRKRGRNAVNLLIAAAAAAQTPA